MSVCADGIFTPEKTHVTSDQRVPIFEHISLYFSRGLIQAEIEFCLSVRDNIQISPHHLKRRLARLQLNEPDTHFQGLRNYPITSRKEKSFSRDE